MILLILTAQRREVLSQIKHLTQMLSILKDDHYIVLLDVIKDIQDFLIEHTATIIKHGPAHHKPKISIQVNALVLGSEFITITVQAIGLA